MNEALNTIHVGFTFIGLYLKTRFITILRKIGFINEAKENRCYLNMMDDVCDRIIPSIKDTEFRNRTAAKFETLRQMMYNELGID